MAKRHFMGLLRARWAQGKFVCVGLDTDADRIPRDFPPIGGMMIQFNRGIVEATADLVCAYKPNIAFYEREGESGWRALRATIELINEIAPDVPVILDASGDVDATVRAAKHNMIINSSSGIIFSDDPRAATQQLDSQIRHTLAEFS